MRRPEPFRAEPFRALLDEARAAEGGVAPPAPPAPIPLAQRLDQVVLAGGTPARGTFLPRRDDVIDLSPARCAPTDDLLAALEPRQEEPTRRLVAGGTVDAALMDTMAELEATIEIPAQRRIAARSEGSPSVPAPVPLKPVPLTPVPLKPVPPKPVTLKPVPLTPVPLKPVPARPVLVRSVPPPLPMAKPKPVPVATRAPAPILSESVPLPRMVQVLGDENTIPGLPPTSRSSSSSSGKMVQQSDLYRLQLEFEDTPARPLPRIAHVPPPPLPPSLGKAPKSQPPHSAPRELRDIEVIDDLQAMARALGLDGVGDVSIPSLEGLPVLDERDQDPSLPDLSAAAELFDDLDSFALPRAASDVRRALALEALDHTIEHSVDDSIERSVETAFADQRASNTGGHARPSLCARKAVTPVIVKIPSRPKVSLEARERARRLYLDAVDRLAKGDRTAAVLHLRLAIDYDDGIPLYRDLLEQLQAHHKAARSPDGPTLTVLGTRGERSQARDHWRSARPR